MFSYRVTVLAVLLGFGSSAMSGQEQPTKSPAEHGSGVAASVETHSGKVSSGALPVLGRQGWPDCDAGGIYRPFSLVRQLKLATAFFVDPTLPETAQIVHAYSLEQAYQALGEDLIDMISSGKTLLAAPVENDVAGALSPVHWSVGDDSVHGTAALNPCRPLSLGESDDGLPRVVYASGSASDPKTWIDSLSKEDRNGFHLLFPDTPPLPNADDRRFVTWDPMEGVGVSRRPEGERQ